MRPRIGLIAGSGEFPLTVLEEARRRGLFCAVLAAAEGAPAELEERADAWKRTGSGRLEEAVAFFREQGVQDVVFAGKIDPADVFRPETRDEAAGRAMAALPDRRPATLIRAAIDLLAARGLRVMDPAPFLEPLMCPEGTLTPSGPSERAAADIDFGWPLARTIADQDVGQTLVVKDGLVVAVEGLEGTDEAIRRAGRLAGPGTVALKVGRTRQDRRVDLPAAGLATVRSLVEAGASALCLEAGRVVFFRRSEALALAASAGLAVVGRRD
jgi:DUF1009 family protein